MSMTVEKYQCEYFANVEDDTLCPDKATHKIKATDGVWYRCCGEHYTVALAIRPDTQGVLL